MRNYEVDHSNSYWDIGLYDPVDEREVYLKKIRASNYIDAVNEARSQVVNGFRMLPLKIEGTLRLKYYDE